MRISDWSSDVCYSDLIALALGQQPLGTIVGGLEQRRVRLQPAGLEDHRQRLLDVRVAVVLVGAAHVGAGIPLAVIGLALVVGGVERVGQLVVLRSEEHTSELQSLMRISYAVFCLKKKKQIKANQAHE